MRIQNEMVNTVKLIDEAMIADLVGQSAAVMSATLLKKTDEGKSQWWNPNLCTISQLRDQAATAVEEGDFISAMNLSAMVVYRERSGA